MRAFGHLLQRFQLDKKAVLDVGCSEGHYLKCFGEGSVGVTIIKEHVAAARTDGLAVIEGNIEDPAFTAPRTFEVVWANNLFEHLHAPHLFLMKARELVSSGGVLILGVPVIPWLTPLLRLRKFRGALAVSHINFFTRRSLIETVRAGGWTVNEARAFYFEQPLLDTLLHGLAPHIYIIATRAETFEYPEKRKRSLQGYEQ